MAGPDQQIDVGGEERLVHRDLHAVGRDEVVPRPELLDEGKDVVPAAAVESRRVVAQLVEDLVHLERREDRLDQHRRADRAVRDPELTLRADEDVVPEPRLEVRLHLRQIKVRTGSACDRFLRIVKKVEAEIEEARRHRLAVDKEMLLQQMPAARTDEQRGGLLIQRVVLLAGGKRDRPPHRIAQVELPIDVVRPRRRVRVFEVRHEDVRAAVERVDDHLPIDRTGDLDPPILQIVRNVRDGPFALANLVRLRQKVRKLAAIDARLASLARRQQLLAPRVESPMQSRHKRKRVFRKDVIPLRTPLRTYVNAAHQYPREH